jgi:hypothetical protein
MLDVSIDLAELETEPGGAGVVGVSVEVTELEAEIFVITGALEVEVFDDRVAFEVLPALDVLVEIASEL